MKFPPALRFGGKSSVVLDFVKRQILGIILPLRVVITSAKLINYLTFSSSHGLLFDNFHHQCPSTSSGMVFMSAFAAL